MRHFSNSNAASKAIRQGAESAADRVYLAYDNVKGAASPALKKLADKANNTAANLSDRAHHVADAVSAKSQHVPSLRQLAGASRNTVKRHPLMTVGIAVAGGVLLSWWLNRRQKQQQSADDQQ